MSSPTSYNVNMTPRSRKASSSSRVNVAEMQEDIKNKESTIATLAARVEGKETRPPSVYRALIYTFCQFI